MLANEKYLMLLDMTAHHKIKLLSAVKKFTLRSTFSFDYQMDHGAPIYVRRSRSIKLPIDNSVELSNFAHYTNFLGNPLYSELHVANIAGCNI